MNLLAQLSPDFFYRPSGSRELITALIVSAVLAILIFVATMNVPTRGRKFVIGVCTFISGVFYVMLLVWPNHQARQPFELPRNGVEKVSFFLEDATPFFKDLGTIVPAFLLGLGVYSLLRVHLGRIIKKHKDSVFSITLLASMVLMAFFGYWDWRQQKFLMKDVDFTNPENWRTAQYGFDFLFDGLLQQMDAAMFSIIAFYILSAAYRAFRIRSVEATIMLSVALIMMLNMMGALQYQSSSLIDQISHSSSFAANFKLEEVSSWIKNTLQVPSLRAMEFGIAIGALAMGIRLWLGLEKSGVA
ncbi:MAG: hypothetical protein JNM85_10400 [Chthonomonas sp.]|nr:hypothetical protein [Chthonomonas sp.]